MRPIDYYKYLEELENLVDIIEDESCLNIIPLVSIVTSTFNHDKFEIQVKNGTIEIDKLQLLGKNIITCRDLYNSNSEFSAKIKNYSVK